MIFEMDFARIIQVYVIQLGLAILYLILGIKIIKRDKKKLNQIIFSFYVLVFFSGLMNVIYAAIENTAIIKILHYITICGTFLASLLVLIFNIIIWKSEKVFNLKKQMVVVILYLLLIAGLAFLLPDYLIMDESTGWKPYYKLEMWIYVLGILTVTLVPNIRISLINHNNFKDAQLKKKWRFFMIGYIANYSLGYLIYTVNYINEPTARLMVSAIGLVLTIVTAIGIYNGLARQLSKK
ncbi:MAG: hypothetical protein GF364_05050 [Candidatus Lokiarchaeota archaeon]|nr:hypothetical protein [Candidatus Lokiarchaeota archaeon]